MGVVKLDKNEAFEFLKRLSDGIAIMFGSTCETLIHDMSVPNHPIIYISNGHISSRKIGSTEDIYGYHTTGEDVDLDRDYINHLVMSKRGRRIKSSTFHMKGEDYHYAFGINFDITNFYEFQKLQEGFLKVSTELFEAINEDDDNRLSTIFENCLDIIGKPVERLNRSDRLRLISLLKEQNAFSFQKSVPYISERLNLSRNTIYKYMKELE